ncbi:ECF transporter S component [Spiroplasma endosymbiont of Othius punctulatus]|uniref:ECF transporter S component n=1 Tax=Spiroplasma endosymbiont of Othius punctulatus TaxID=3066289 RepID=UPI0030CA6BCE
MLNIDNNNIDEKEIKDEVISDSNNIETHDIEHVGDEPMKDHYHDKHHFTSDGEHDDIDDGEFEIKKYFWVRSKGELIYKISASGIILALALIMTAIDGYGLEVPLMGLFNGVLVPIRIFDLLVILIGLSVTGPLFGGVIGFILPWIHFLMHAHSIFTPVIESFAYAAMVLIFWLVYFGLFKNSPFHKDPNPKKDKFKRWAPMPIIVLIGVVLFTSVTILILYINQLTGASHHHHDSMASTFHEHDEHSESLFDFLSESKWNIAILIGLQFIRFIVCYVLFALIEPKAKLLNHRRARF